MRASYPLIIQGNIPHRVRDRGGRSQVSRATVGVAACGMGLGNCRVRFSARTLARRWWERRTGCARIRILPLPPLRGRSTWPLDEALGAAPWRPTGPPLLLPATASPCLICRLRCVCRSGARASLGEAPSSRVTTTHPSRPSRANASVVNQNIAPCVLIKFALPRICPSLRIRVAPCPRSLLGVLLGRTTWEYYLGVTCSARCSFLAFLAFQQRRPPRYFTAR
jgi:hypothetical protein